MEFLVDGKYKVDTSPCNGVCEYVYFLENVRTGYIHKLSWDGQNIPPIGAEGAKLKFQRDKVNFGINFLYNDGSQKLEFCCQHGSSHIISEYEREGTDACIRLVIVEVSCDCEPDILFAGMLDFASIDINKAEDCNCVKVNIVEDSKLLDLKNSLDLEVEICRDTAINGDPIGNPAYKQVGLHSKGLDESYRGEANGSCLEISLSTVPQLTNIFGLNPVKNPIDFDGRFFTAPTSGFYTFTGLLGYTIDDPTSCLGITTVTYYTSVNGDPPTSHVVGFPPLVTGINFTLNLNAGDRVEFWAEFFTSVVFPGCPVEICVQDNSFLEINHVGYAEPSCVKAIAVNDLLKRLIEIYCGDDSILVTPLFEDGCHNDNVITNGHLLRGIDEEDYCIQASFKQIAECLQMRFATGYGIDIINGDTKLVLDQWEYFFKESQIMYFGPDVHWGLQCTAATELLHNKITLQYEKNNLESGESTSFDEFHTRSTWINCITKFKAEFKKACNLITSGGLIEKARRAQFSDSNNDSISDEEDLYMINVEEIEPFVGSWGISTFGDANFIRIPELITYCPGQVITISGTGACDGVFTIGSIEHDYAQPGSPFSSFTQLNIVEPLCGLNSVNGTITVSGACQAVRNNAQIATVSGVFDPKTQYNLVHSLKRAFYSWGRWFNSVQCKEDPTECLYQYTSGTGNKSLTTQINSGGCVDCDSLNIGQPEDSDIPMFGVCNGRNKFCPEFIKFSVPFNKSQMDLILNNRYGYISVENKCQGSDCDANEILKGWIWNAEFEPNAPRGCMTFTLLRKHE